MNNFKAGGIELPDLMDAIVFKDFKEWNGNSHNVQHIPTKFISKSYLDKLKKENEMKVDE